MLTALTLAVAIPLIAAAGACADPAIVAAGVQSVQHNGEVDHIVVGVTVKNLGTADESPSLLQSVEIFQDATRVDRKGVQPLKAGASSTFTYAFDRNADAHANSTRLRFELHLSDPHRAVSDCSTGNDVFRVEI